MKEQDPELSVEEMTTNLEKLAETDPEEVEKLALMFALGGVIRAGMDGFRTDLVGPSTFVGDLESYEEIIQEAFAEHPEPVIKLGPVPVTFVLIIEGKHKGKVLLECSNEAMQKAAAGKK